MPAAKEKIQAIKMVCSEILAQVGVCHQTDTHIPINMDVILNASKILSKLQNYREEFRIFGVDIDKNRVSKILNEGGDEFVLRLFIDKYKDEFAIFGISVKNNYIHYLDKKVITYTNIVGI